MSDDAPEDLFADQEPPEPPPPACERCGRTRCDEKDCEEHRLWRAKHRMKFTSLRWS